MAMYVNNLLEDRKGNENENEWDKTNIKTLRNEFFYYLKKWLDPKRSLEMNLQRKRSHNPLMTLNRSSPSWILQ